MDSIHIREATPGDLPQILTLIAQPDMDDGVSLSMDEANGLVERIFNNPDHHLYVAVCNGEIVGTFALILIQHLSHKGARSAIVEDVVVRTEWQRLGVGRKMMAFAAEQGRKLGCYKLVLSSGKQRDRAHKFYESLGFERHGVSFLLDLH